MYHSGLTSVLHLISVGAKKFRGIKSGTGAQKMRLNFLKRRKHSRTKDEGKGAAAPNYSSGLRNSGE